MNMRNPAQPARSQQGIRVLSGKRLIVVALPLLSESEISLVQGIREELGRRGEFEIMILSGGYEAPLRKVAQRGELVGVIGDFMSRVWLKSLLGRGVRVVRIGDGADDTFAGAGNSSVGSNIGIMGSEAARVLAGSGIQDIAYLGPAGSPGSVRLGEAFTAACSAHGREVIRCSASTGVLLTNFLLALRRPAGLLCASDHLARLAIATAQEEGIRVPQDLAVIGVGNSRMESLHAGMAISSFEPPLAEIGRLAGAAMADLLEGKTVEPVAIDPLLHERESSLRATGVERALAWLKSHPDSDISAGELARLAGMSRRSFETAVRSTQGISPGALMQGIRRRRAEKLLRETSLDIAAVGRECGYPEAAAFSTAFKRWTGSSPRTFRASSLSA